MTCHEDSTRTDTHYCRCNAGVRDPYTFGCVAYCPHFYQANFLTSECVFQSHSLIAELSADFTNDISNFQLNPTFNAWCHLPDYASSTIGDSTRHLYFFNGESESIQVGSFIPSLDSFVFDFHFAIATGQRGYIDWENILEN